MSKAASCGSWKSPVTAELVVSGAVGFGEVVVAESGIWWSESRPDEGGRVVIVRDGVDVIPENINVRTLVHEYGGGAWSVASDDLIYSNYEDQRLYKLSQDGQNTILTPEPEISRGLRYANGVPTPDGDWFICVQEKHSEMNGEPANSLVAISLHGAQQVNQLALDADFFSSPAISPNGKQLCWIQWNHPNMPWDNTELWVADFQDGEISNEERIGTTKESFFQPSWSPEGQLHVVTDRDNWWHLYRLEDKEFVQLTFGDFEIATPQWVFGLSRYVFLEESIWFAYSKSGQDHLAVLEEDGSVSEMHLEATSIGSLASTVDGVAAVVASYGEEPAVVQITSGDQTACSTPRDLGLKPEWFPQPELLEFPTSEGETAWAQVYVPTNPEFQIPDGELPPLIVLAHGGPTGAARTQLQLSIAWWTSRGFCVADVDYRGSTGYGREYRHRLHDNWGILDVEDCVAIAEHLVKQKRVDQNRLAIKGGSAGGFTVLAALTFHDIFSAGASRYGVADLEALAKDTHKFEARYLDRLIGLWPESKDIYESRSPIKHTNQLNTPLLLLQGSLDPIVPPNQAHMMAEALKKKNLPFALLEFPDEGHGFRKAENQIRALQAELSFFANQFDFTPEDPLPSLTIN